MTEETLHSRLLIAATRAVKLFRLVREPGMWRSGARALRAGVLPSLEHAAVPFREGILTVLDVGSSRGQFALFALDRFPDATLVCFEPLPEAREVARRVLRNPRAEIHGVALGSTSGDAALHVSAHDDSSSVLPIGRRQVAAFPGTHAVRDLTVPMDVLASYIDDRMPRPCLLKIDVQGSELDVLRGAGSAGLSRVDEILVEASFVELYTGQALAGNVVAYLAQHGFQLVDIHGLARSADGTALQADLLFRASHGREGQA